MRVSVNKCDLCGKEDRSDEPKHWTRQGGKVTLSFKDVTGNQNEQLFDYLCIKCANQLQEKIWKAIDEIRKKNSPISVG